MELRNVLRRWLNEVLTTVLKSFSSHPNDFRSLRTIRITALLTFGGGSNTFSLTVNRYSTSYQACSRTLRMPYVLLPGPAARRSATSFLYHTRTAGNMFLVVEHFEKYLTGYIIRIIANHTKLVRKQLAEIQTQKVFGQNLAFQDGKVLFQVIDRFHIQLHYCQIVSFFQ